MANPIYGDCPPSSFDMTMRSLEPFAWPLTVVLVAFAIVLAAVILRPRRG